MMVLVVLGAVVWLILSFVIGVVGAFLIRVRSHHFPAGESFSGWVLRLGCYFTLAGWGLTAAMFLTSYLWRVHAGTLPTPGIITGGQWLFAHWWLLPVAFTIAATVAILVRWWRLRDTTPVEDNYVFDQEPTAPLAVEPPAQQQMWSLNDVMPATQQWDHR